ncbi:microtubule organization protein AKNA-like [Sapajus apella]|uniref:Microtubule organization protein AKNA-like n=1 Tax=Sapajus apella TaxID=9515 RepID=A0A6J3HFC9_SAPAP|nr:microtubule organization protein AKNA-like [Sapajus apella]
MWMSFQMGMQVRMEMIRWLLTAAGRTRENGAPAKAAVVDLRAVDEFAIFTGEAEAEDADSPASSHKPLAWLPPQGHQLDMTEEEPDRTLGSPEVEDAGESCPRLGYEAGLSLEGHGNTSPMALGQGQVRAWVASGEQAGGDKLSEHSEVNPSVELSPARSWSSGTVSLYHPSDSLDSTWEGEIDGSPPTALAETLPESPSHHLLHPDDRTGGSVAQATLMEFQDSSAPPAQSPQRAADRWRRETTRFACPQPEEHIWKLTKTSPKPLPSRFIGSISPLNPQPRPIRQGTPLPRQGATLAGRSSSNAPKYGRGQLNYPLPDFSKVGPRVRFPKDESYRPPKSRSHNRQPQGPARPLIFKSPAEIVQEVLLSSGEAALAKDMPPAHPITRVPQEFQTPEQATELVHQLQEDYHRLLTKYAEAENTIDQLRLGAKVPGWGGVEAWARVPEKVTLFRSPRERSLPPPSIEALEIVERQFLFYPKVPL